MSTELSPVDATQREIIAALSVAPVFDAAGHPVAGVGVCIPKPLLPSSGERLRGVVIRVAGRLSERIGGRVVPAAASGSTS